MSGNSVISLVVITCFCLFSVVAQNYEVTFQLQEEKAVDTVFGNIAREIQLHSVYSQEDFQSFQYYFLGTSVHQHLFKIDSTTSDLSIAMRIDREKECPELRNCILEFNVGVRSPRPDFFIFITVKVIVEDKNDHSPMFTNKEIVLNISESSVVGSEFQVDAAVDPDIGINGIQSYELTPSSEMFGLRVVTKLDGSFELKIVVNAPLDRENTDSYHVQITAKDGGSVQNYGILKINISVIDTNDNSPEFEHEEYNATVREDADVGEVIIKVTAVDIDAGNNGQMTYRFSDKSFNFEEVSRLFRINHTTGEVFVASELEYKPNKRYIIYIEASDQGKPFRVSQTVLNIDIVDSGNNPPVVLVNLLSPGNVMFVEIPETSENGSFIAHVNVEDLDTGPNAQVSCQVPSPKFDIQTLGNGYIVVLKSSLDREIAALHTVTVVCQDHGSPPLSASASFLVKVLDENDNKPEFTQNVYSTTLKENNKKGEILAHVSAHDRDAVSTPNSEIRYFIETGANSNFSINPNTGIVSTNTVFDREVTQDVSFRVFAVDQGTSPLTGTTTINVKILDENDNAPQFPSSEIPLRILENGTMDTVVGKINATDADEGENGEITYFMSQEFKLFIPFIVYPDGVVRSSDKLNREQQSKYDFIVIAKDQGNPSLNSSVFVSINVIDINDMSPVIEFPNNWNNTVTIFHNSAINTLITKIKAYDLDQGINKILRYSIEDGNEEEIFSINSETGEVFLAKNYDIQNDKLFPLMICVKDSGSPELLTRTQLNVVLAVNIPNESSNKYIIISIVVVVVTVIISAALITGIFFLRRNDKRRQLQQKQEHKYKREFLFPTDSENSVKNTNEQNQNDNNIKQKKEVSFSFSENIGKQNGGLNNSTVNSSENNSSMYPKLGKSSNVNELEDKEQLKRECQLKALKLHQLMMDPEKQTWGGSDKHQLKDKHRSHYEDSHSETSGETTTSDSGRGGSEDETITPPSSHNDSRLSSYPYQAPYHFPSTFIVSSKTPTSIQHSQQQPSVPVLSTFQNVNNKQHVSDQHINKKISQPLIHIPKQAISPHQFYSVDNVMECYPAGSAELNSFSYGPQNLCYSRQESMSTLRSREDDDDAATTTSGSYTINPEELNDDIYQLQKDMFV